MKKLLIIFIVLNILDVLTTIIGTRLGAIEINSLMKYAIETSTALFVAVKMVLCIIIGLLLVKFRKERILKVVCVIFTAIVISNTIIIGIML